MSYNANPTESDDSRFSFLEIDGVGESAQEPADKPAPAPAPKAEAPAPGPVLVPVEKAPKARVTAETLIAVNSSSGSVGRLTYWSTTGALEVTKLTEAWAAEGLDANDLPEIPSAKVALSRACKAQSTKSVLLRQHSEGGWTLTDLAGKVDLTKTTEDATLDKVVEQNGVRVRLSEAAPGKPEQILLTPPGGKNASQEVKDAAAVLGNKIRAEFNEARNEVSATDVRGWLVTTVAKLSGVALRDKGGFYFVPKMGAEKLLKIKAALKAASASAHKVYAIPVMQGEETIEAAMDSLRDELAAIVKATEDELSNPEGMGARAAANRIEDLTAFSAKIKSYESLLGVTLGAETALASLRDRLGKVSVDGTAGRAAALEID